MAYNPTPKTPKVPFVATMMQRFKPFIETLSILPVLVIIFGVFGLFNDVYIYTTIVLLLSLLAERWGIIDNIKNKFNKPIIEENKEEKKDE